MEESETTIWTVGHSNHTADAFLALLRSNQIEFLVDVRSYPYSNYAPHFNREALKGHLPKVGLRYLFLGDTLGGRPDVEDHFDDEGHALYGEMAKLSGFRKGIDRLIAGASSHRLAIMCSCGMPDDCHRRLLVGRVLTEAHVKLVHILPNGELRRESSVPLGPIHNQQTLFGDKEVPWRSTQSVSQRRRLKTSSAA